MGAHEHSYTCGCGKVELRPPPCACMPVHKPKPFSSMDRSKCAWHGPDVPVHQSDYGRAAGDEVCSCGHPYREHAHDDKVLGYDQKPFLRVLCDGRRVKL